jgi:hypothetical protein
MAVIIKGMIFWEIVVETDGELLFSMERKLFYLRLLMQPLTSTGEPYEDSTSSLPAFVVCCSLQWKS